MGSDLRVRFFGTFEVWQDDVPISPKSWPQRKTQTLLKILVSQRGQVFTQDQLIDMLFVDIPYDNASRNLHKRISELRRLLEPDLKRGAESQFVIRSGQGYLFSKDATCWVDLEIFDHALLDAHKAEAEGEWARTLTLYQEIESLYEGDFLSEDLYEEWTQPLRTHWQERFLNAMERLTESHARVRQYRQAIEYGNKLLQRDPYREGAYRKLIRYYWRLGEQTKISQTFQMCQEKLDQLGIVPSEETLTLYQKIQAGDVSDIEHLYLPPESIPTKVSSIETNNNIPIDPPSGVVTFLFTDIEGSTLLWEQHPEEMKVSLEHHDQMLRQTLEQHGGYVFNVVGDAFYAAFSQASDALKAAIEIQQALLIYPWHEATQIKVRMAIHSGTTYEREGNYLGPVLNYLSRLLALGHGNQVLVSLGTYELAPHAELENVQLKDLGQHRLKSFNQLQRIFQVQHPKLPQDFPELQAVANSPNNLPRQLTSFIGRKRDVEEVKLRLNKTSLLTLTGIGGAGKTRLSLRVAADLIEEYEDGVWFVELAAISDPELIPRRIASVLNLQEMASQSLLDSIKDKLCSQHILLILDNCEHLLGPCAQIVSELLTHCSQLKILTTSREPLKVMGEMLWPVAPLSVPSLQALEQIPDSVPTLTRSEAGQLFLERVMAVQPNFELTPQNAPAVVTICHRLDGIPLALELAAARIPTIPATTLAARLEDRFKLLSGGSTTSLPRQQTLRATIDWSFDLLSDDEQVLISRVSVFRGTFVLEAAESVCEGGGINKDVIIVLLDQLVHKSLVEILYEKDQIRYRLLETVQQYAFEKLEESGQLEKLQRAHCRHFTWFAERADEGLKGEHQAEWIMHVRLDHGNTRAALKWALTYEPKEALHLAAALSRFWWTHGNFTEGGSWLQRTLDAAPKEPSKWRAHALWGLGLFHRYQGNLETSKTHTETSLSIYEEIEDSTGMSTALGSLGNQALESSDPDTARQYFERSLEISRSLGDDWAVSRHLDSIGLAYFMEDDFVRSEEFHREALKVCEGINDPQGIGISSLNLGHVLYQTGNIEEAKQCYEKSLKNSTIIRHRLLTVYGLTGMAVVEAVNGNDVWAANLIGLVDVSLKALDAIRDLIEQSRYDDVVQKLKASLNEQAYEQAIQAGEKLTLTQAVAKVLQVDETQL